MSELRSRRRSESRGLKRERFRRTRVVGPCPCDMPSRAGRHGHPHRVAPLWQSAQVNPCGYPRTPHDFDPVAIDIYADLAIADALELRYVSRKVAVAEAYLVRGCRHDSGHDAAGGRDWSRRHERFRAGRKRLV